MDMMMTSNSSKKASSNSTAAASAHHHHHQHQQQQEPMGTAPQVVEVRNVKQAGQEAAVSGGGERKPRPQLDEALRCPRCDSNNTKFCYYNNYNTLQPRYFCKACRRYWTQGGSLRNVPIGGGCRKNKRASLLPSSTSSSSSINNKLQQQLFPTSSTVDFPNVLPTFMSTGFELPRTHLLPFSPLSSSSLLAPAPPLDSGAGTTTSSFLNMLKAGFLDHQGNNNFYGPTSSGIDMPLSFGFGEHGVVGDHGGSAAPIGGGGATHEGGQWPTTQVGPANQQQEGASVPDTVTPK